MRLFLLLACVLASPVRATTFCLMDGDRKVGRAEFTTQSREDTRTDRAEWVLHVRGAREEGDLVVSTEIVRDPAGIRSVSRAVAAGRVPDRIFGTRTAEGWVWQSRTGAAETTERSAPPADDGPVHPGITSPHAWFDPLDLQTLTLQQTGREWHSADDRRVFGLDDGQLVVRRAVLFERAFDVVPCAPAEARRRKHAIDPIAAGGWSLPVAVDAPLLGTRLGFELTGFPGPPAIPPSAEQQWRIHGDALRLRVCADCRNAPDPVIDPAWLQANAFVDAEDPAIRTQAAALRRKDPKATVRAITRFVKRHLWQETDELGYASASQALRERRGNCSEHAVLLAALARANGIPARIVHGLVHHRERRDRSDRLLPHAWVQVHVDGRWQSVDAAQDRGFSAGHVALMLGDGDPHAVYAALSQWRGVRVARVVRFD